MDIQDVISCYDHKIEQLEQENTKLKKENAKLKKQNSDAGWQYEFDHANDWRIPIEMGQL